MKLKALSLSASAILLLSSCGGGTKDSNKEASADTEKAATPKTCLYSYNSGATSMKWTAYKTTEKKGVGGTFNDLTVSNTTDSENALEVVQNASFVIDPTSVNSKLEDRDKKITEHFFGTMSEVGKITGHLGALNADGTGTLTIKMNGIEKEVPVSYTQEGEKVTVNGTIDVSLWDVVSSIEALNKVCYELHKGADGVSKLWTEVSIEIETTLKKNCR